jgi:DNA repair protein RadC
MALPAQDDKKPLRPREKLTSLGPASLTDAELLAIFLRTGTRGKPALLLAEELLSHFRGLHQLVTADFESILSVKGLGTAKTCQLVAILEMARRYLKQQATRNDYIQSPAQARDFVKTVMAAYKSETFACLFLDTRNRVIGYRELFHGSINGASVYPREVVKSVLKENAAAVIFAHNHPSGDATPSDADIAVTQRLQQALALIDVRVLDHLIVGEQVQSMAELNYL